METVLAIPTIAQLCRFLYVPLGTSPCLPEKGERRWKGDILAVTETTLKSSNKKIGQGSRNQKKKTDTNYCTLYSTIQKTNLSPTLWYF